jgi:hypothetical protein
MRDTKNKRTRLIYLFNLRTYCLSDDSSRGGVVAL